MNWKTIKYDRVDSTNDEARRLISKGQGNGLVVSAQHQVTGRGRRGREWWSLPGKSILASFVFENVDSGEATRLISTSAIAAIHNNHSKGPLIKWPNDLVYEKKKVGGILSEAFSENGRSYTIVGLGLNLNYTRKELVMGRCLKATSLLIEEGKTFDAGPLLENITGEIEKRFDAGKEKSLAEYREHLAFVGKKISLKTESSKTDGVFAGVDDNGFLLLKTRANMKSFPVGEVRKVKI